MPKLPQGVSSQSSELTKVVSGKRKRVSNSPVRNGILPASARTRHKKKGSFEEDMPDSACPDSEECDVNRKRSKLPCASSKKSDVFCTSYTSQSVEHFASPNKKICKQNGGERPVLKRKFCKNKISRSVLKVKIPSPRRGTQSPKVAKSKHHEDFENTKTENKCLVGLAGTFSEDLSNEKRADKCDSLQVDEDCPTLCTDTSKSPTSIISPCIADSDDSFEISEDDIVLQLHSHKCTLNSGLQQHAVLVDLDNTPKLKELIDSEKLCTEFSFNAERSFRKGSIPFERNLIAVVSPIQSPKHQFKQSNAVSPGKKMAMSENNSFRLHVPNIASEASIPMEADLCDKQATGDTRSNSLTSRTESNVVSDNLDTAIESFVSNTQKEKSIQRTSVEKEFFASSVSQSHKNEETKTCQAANNISPQANSESQPPESLCLDPVVMLHPLPQNVLNTLKLHGSSSVPKVENLEKQLCTEKKLVENINVENANLDITSQGKDNILDLVPFKETANRLNNPDVVKQLCNHSEDYSLVKKSPTKKSTSPNKSKEANKKVECVNGYFVTNSDQMNTGKNKSAMKKSMISNKSKEMNKKLKDENVSLVTSSDQMSTDKAKSPAKKSVISDKSKEVNKNLKGVNVSLKLNSDRMSTDKKSPAKKSLISGKSKEGNKRLNDENVSLVTNSDQISADKNKSPMKKSAISNSSKKVDNKLDSVNFSVMTNSEHLSTYEENANYVCDEDIVNALDYEPFNEEIDRENLSAVFGTVYDDLKKVHGEDLLEESSGYKELFSGEDMDQPCQTITPAISVTSLTTEQCQTAYSTLSGDGKGHSCQTVSSTFSKEHHEATNSEDLSSDGKGQLYQTTPAAPLSTEQILSDGMGLHCQAISDVSATSLPEEQCRTNHSENLLNEDERQPYHATTAIHKEQQYQTIVAVSTNSLVSGQYQTVRSDQYMSPKATKRNPDLKAADKSNHQSSDRTRSAENTITSSILTRKLFQAELPQDLLQSTEVKNNSLDEFMSADEEMGEADIDLQLNLPQEEHEEFEQGEHEEFEAEEVEENESDEEDRCFKRTLPRNSEQERNYKYSSNEVRNGGRAEVPPKVADSVRSSPLLPDPVINVSDAPEWLSMPPRPPDYSWKRLSNKCDKSNSPFLQEMPPPNHGKEYIDRIITSIEDSCKASLLNKAFKESKSLPHYTPNTRKFEVLELLLASCMKCAREKVSELYDVLQSFNLCNSNGFSGFILKCKIYSKNTFDIVKKIFEVCESTKCKLTDEAIAVLKDIFSSNSCHSLVLPVRLISYAMFVCLVQNVDLELLDDILSMSVFPKFQKERTQIIAPLAAVLLKLTKPQFQKLQNSVPDFLKLLEETTHVEDVVVTQLKKKYFTCCGNPDFESFPTTYEVTSSLPVEPMNSEQMDPSQYSFQVEMEHGRWDQVARKFRHSTQFSQSFEFEDLHKELNAVPAEAPKRLKSFITCVAGNEDNLSSVPAAEAYIILSIGTAIMLEANHNSQYTTAFEVYQVLRSYDESYTSVMEEMYRHGFLRKLSCRLAKPRYLSSSIIALTIVDICLNCEEFIEALHVFKDYNWVELDTSNDDFVWRAKLLLKLCHSLKKKRSYMDGVIVLKVLLKTLEQDKDSKCIPESVCEDISECYNEYLAVLLNGAPLKEAEELLSFKHENGHPSLELYNIISRGFVVVAMEKKMVQKGKDLFADCCLLGIYSCNLENMNVGPPYLCLPTHLVNCEIELILQSALDKLFMMMAEFKVKKDFAKWFSLRICLKESTHDKKVQLNVFKDISNSIDDAHLRTIEVLKSMQLAVEADKGNTSLITIVNESMYKKYLLWLQKNDIMLSPESKHPASDVGRNSQSGSQSSAITWDRRENDQTFGKPPNTPPKLNVRPENMAETMRRVLNEVEHVSDAPLQSSAEAENSGEVESKSREDTSKQEVSINSKQHICQKHIKFWESKLKLKPSKAAKKKFKSKKNYVNLSISVSPDVNERTVTPQLLLKSPEATKSSKVIPLLPSPKSSSEIIESLVLDTEMSSEDRSLPPDKITVTVQNSSNAEPQLDTQPGLGAVVGEDMAPCISISKTSMQGRKLKLNRNIACVASEKIPESSSSGKFLEQCQSKSSPGDMKIIRTVSPSTGVQKRVAYPLPDFPSELWTRINNFMLMRVKQSRKNLSEDKAVEQADSLIQTFIRQMEEKGLRRPREYLKYINDFANVNL